MSDLKSSRLGFRSSGVLQSSGLDYSQERPTAGERNTADAVTGRLSFLHTHPFHLQEAGISLPV